MSRLPHPDTDASPHDASRARARRRLALAAAGRTERGLGCTLL
jgi:hypothetical protein